MHILSAFAALLLVFGFIILSESKAPQIIRPTTYGPVRGLLQSGDRNTTYFSFRGIPYAKPPVGPLRFRDPQYPEPWTKPFDATKNGPVPYALNMIMTEVEPTASEDCLRLNVYSRSVKPSAKQPVMVWLYGGGFTSGQSTVFGPDYFMEKNVVIVTVNYRVGALGFLSIEESEFQIPGNAGLKDQRLALHWIRDNIRQFGGDPNSVTMFGQSAGAASIHYHMLSDMSRGLFHKGILQSGSSLCSWTIGTRDDKAERLARKLGWNGVGGTTAMMAVLQAAAPADIVLNQRVGNTEEAQGGAIAAFVPVVEPYDHGSNFIPVHPEQMLEHAWGNRIPILTGANEAEGFLLFNLLVKATGILQSSTPMEITLPANFPYPIGHPIRQFFADQMRDLYHIQLPLTETNIHQIEPIYGHKLIWHGVFSTVTARLRYGTPADGATYLYRFEYESEHLLFMQKLMAGSVVNLAVHCEELLYLWNMFNENKPMATKDLKFSQYMIEIWTQFATTGNPNTEETKSLDWQPLQKTDTELKCFNIGREESNVISLPETKYLLFWTLLRNMPAW